MVGGLSVRECEAVVTVLCQEEVKGKQMTGNISVTASSNRVKMKTENSINSQTAELTIGIYCHALGVMRILFLSDFTNRRV